MASYEQASSRTEWSSLRGDLFDVGQPPHLVKKLLLRRIETEHQLELARRIGRHPVRLLSGRRLGAEKDVDRAIGVLLHLGSIRRAARARHVLDQGVRL